MPSCLPQDGLAQVLSYLDCKPVMLTLSAVSPQARLDAETLHNKNVGDSPSPACCQCQVVEYNKLMFSIDAKFRLVELPRFRMKLWWAERCGLPLSLRNGIAHRLVLSTLSDTLRCRVETLKVKLWTAETCPSNSGTSSTWEGHCGSVLCSLATFCNLSSLSIECATPSVSAQFPSCLPLRVPLRTLNLSHAQALTDDTSFLSCFESLRSASLFGCGIQTVKAVVGLRMLKKLDVSCNRNLTTLSALAEASHLKQLLACRCNLLNVDGLSTCARLREVDLSDNENLTSLAGLAAAPRLQKISAWNCCLQTLLRLNECESLREIDVSCNENLTSLYALAGAPLLEVIEAYSCSLTTLGNLSRCFRFFFFFDVSYNAQLSDFYSLVGAPKLERISAQRCQRCSANVLREISCLRYVNISDTLDMNVLSAFAASTNLVELTATRCGLRSLKALRGRLSAAARAGRLGEWRSLRHLRSCRCTVAGDVHSCRMHHQ